jgi:acyl carrier protein
MDWEVDQMDNISVLSELGDPSRNLKELAMDSLDWLDFKIRLEDEENISMEDDALSNFHTVQDIHDFVERSRT